MSEKNDVGKKVGSEQRRTFAEGIDVAKKAMDFPHRATQRIIRLWQLEWGETPANKSALRVIAAGTGFGIILLIVTLWLFLIMDLFIAFWDWFKSGSLDFSILSSVIFFLLVIYILVPLGFGFFVAGSSDPRHSYLTLMWRGSLIPALLCIPVMSLLTIITILNLLLANLFN
jgi:hypothetical protein